MTYGKWNTTGSLTFADGDVLTASNINTSFTICPPIGGIMAWHKSFENTPALPTGWVECNGQTLSDAASPYNGQTIPDLNGSSGSQRFLCGSTTSGSIGGVYSHNHMWSDKHTSGGNLYGLTMDGTAVGGPTARSFDRFGDVRNFPNTSNTLTGSHYTDAIDNVPPFFTIVWIMRVK